MRSWKTTKKNSVTTAPGARPHRRAAGRGSLALVGLAAGLLFASQTLLAASAAPPERHPPGTLVTAGTIRLYIEKEGSGPPLVLLPAGPGLDHAYFHPYLSSLTPWRTVVYLDPRGCGRSELGRGGDLDTDAMVFDLEQVRLALGSERLDLLGHGIGEAVAVLYADRHPDRVGRLIIVGGAGHPGSFLDEPRLEALTTPGMKTALAQAGADRYLSADGRLRERFRILVPLFFQRLTDHAFQRAFVDQITLSDEVRNILAPRMGRNPQGFERALGKLSIPVLIVAGRYDPTATVEQAEGLRAMIPSSRLAILEESGSFPFAEQPVEFLRLVREFLGAMGEGAKVAGAGGGI